MVAALGPVGSPTGLLLYVTGIDQIIQRPAYRAHGQLCVPADRADGGDCLLYTSLRADATLNESLTPWDSIMRLESYDGVWVAENKAAITERYSECLENAG